MPIITWSEFYSVDDENIDEQHAVLCGMVNEVFDSIPRKDWDTIERVIGELFKYTECHFSMEERVMELADYPDLENHKKIHQQLLEKAVEVSKLFEQDRRKGALELSLFLREWLIKHIRGVDAQYTPYITKRKVSKEIRRLFNEQGTECESTA